jgi:hypothetical protein
MPSAIEIDRQHPNRLAPNAIKLALRIRLIGFYQNNYWIQPPVITLKYKSLLNDLNYHNGVMKLSGYPFPWE